MQHEYTYVGGTDCALSYVASILLAGTSCIFGRLRPGIVAGKPAHQY